MFRLNSFVSTQGSNKGTTVHTAILGTNPDPRDRSNEHIGAKIAVRLVPILSDPVQAAAFLAILRTVAGVETPTPTPVPAPTPVTPPVPAPTTPQPVLSTQETLDAIQESKTIPATDRAGKGPAKGKGKGKGGRKSKAAMEPITTTVPDATVNVTVALPNKDESLETLKAEAKALKIRGYALFKDISKIKEAIAKAKGETVKPETPTTPTPAATKASLPLVSEPLGTKPEMYTPPAERNESETTPEPAATKIPKRTLVTVAAGQNGVTYAIYQTENGSLVAVADTAK